MVPAVITARAVIGAVAVIVWPVIGRRCGIDGRGRRIAGWRPARRWAARSEARCNHVAVLTLERDLAPLALTAGHINRSARRNFGDDGIGRARPLPQVDRGVDDRWRRAALRPTGRRRPSLRTIWRWRPAWRRTWRRAGLV